MKMKHILAITLTAMASSTYAGHNSIDPNTTQFDCKVVGVSDGDTLTCVGQYYKKIRVRLAEIDAPEKSQAFGQKAKQRLSDYVFGKMVTVTYEKEDRYGRVIGEVYLQGSQNAVNYAMVQDGLAWAYERYNKDRAYLTAQQQAKSDKKGLWVDSNPINPEDYRHNK